ncbi:hypothetical protein BGZ57DRAFT_862472 [Hyaloscypha finlandica]|nr:hypothetical protein BGZ57DRAFT_862472 [Hyaloscypha finlandica]
MLLPRPLNVLEAPISSAQSPKPSEGILSRGVLSPILYNSQERTRGTISGQNNNRISQTQLLSQHCHPSIAVSLSRSSNDVLLSDSSSERQCHWETAKRKDLPRIQDGSDDSDARPAKRRLLLAHCSAISPMPEPGTTPDTLGDSPVTSGHISILSHEDSYSAIDWDEPDITHSNNLGGFRWEADEPQSQLAVVQHRQSDPSSSSGRVWTNEALAEQRREELRQQFERWSGRCSLCYLRQETEQQHQLENCQYQDEVKKIRKKFRYLQKVIKNQIGGTCTHCGLSDAPWESDIHKSLGGEWNGFKEGGWQCRYKGVALLTFLTILQECRDKDTISSQEQ